jgi:hypothetical protein
VIPDTDTLAHAYRREKQSAYLRPEFEKLLAASSDYADEVEIPDDLETKARELLEEHPALPWNEAVARIAE